MTAGLTRRRFIHVAGIAAGCGLLPLGAAAAPAGAPPFYRWQGVALGADASLVLYHPDRAEAARLVGAALAEVRRLEGIFSLYDRNSALSRLNRDGTLDDPPAELVELLAASDAFSSATGGAFDVTVQPLWDLYAHHFARPGADPAGPSPAAIAATLAWVGHDAIAVAPDRVAFRRPGLSVTFNGIAQGYITDRVAALLRAFGIGHTLVDMGEIRALDGHPAGRPWQVGLRDEAHPGRLLRTVPLDDRAIATSSGLGTRFDPGGRFNHIFNPATGACANRYLSVSVQAPTATIADALSTAFSLMPVAAIRPVLAATGADQAWIADHQGRVTVIAA